MASSSAVSTQEQKINRGQRRRFLTKGFVSVLLVTMIAYIADVRVLSSFLEVDESMRQMLEWSPQDKTEVRTNIATGAISTRGGPVMQPREASNQLNDPAKREMIVTNTTFLRSNISTAAGIGTIQEKTTTTIATIQNNKLKLDKLNISPTLSPGAFRFNYTKSVETGCCNHGRLCHVTCFTERACQGRDPSYPFSSEEEKKWFEKEPDQRGLGKVCQTYMNQPIEDPTWCQRSSLRSLSTSSSSSSSSAGRKIDRVNPVSINTTMDLSLIPTGCSRITMGGLSGPFDRTFVIPKGKLVFCGIPKVGITQWFKFARFVMGAADYQSHPYNKLDFKEFHLDRLPRHRQEALLMDPTWTKAIFLRDPAERLLSAYLDKVAEGESKKVFNNETIAKFAEWVRELEQGGTISKRCHVGNTSKNGHSWCWDPHWRPQVYSCGISELLPYFDFVGSISQAANHSKALLQMVGLWDSHGMHYITQPDAQGCAVPPPDPESPQHRIFHAGFQQKDLAKQDNHTTNSKSKLDLFYSTPQLLDIVKRIYKDDYTLWNALTQQPGRDWVRGSTLANQLNPDCQIPTTTTTTKEKW